MAYDLKSEDEVKDYIKNLGIEYRFGCYSEKKPEVCHLLADFLEAIKKDYEKAAKVYKNNCDEYKFGKSCLKYGGYCLTGKGVKTSNYPAAYNYFEKGCNLDEPYSCFNQAILLVTKNDGFGVKQDVLKGMELLQKACAAQNGMACYYLSGLYIAGAKNGSSVGDKGEKDSFDIPRNMEKAFKYALEGCNLGNMYSCANVSQMYTKGDGVEKNLELADKYKKRALEMQEEATKNAQTLKFGVGLD
ncbi:cytochrome c oxidase assembly factor 7 homolog [Anthonomus grandis grandis]|uniref:cytochrome c oxidase assembly factor 7 homolog n=1 Tax=Anthonomus grandis grandis TaxID=2921223 RepID=UPI0021666C22|nr:cytochrome c oxidase assembly factor 7 homolog [Anthonomus grandis grandis]